MLWHVIHSTCQLWFSCFPTRNTTFHEFLCFLSGIVIFYCGTWGNMKRCLFLLVFAVNFNVSMKRHMLIVSLFFARCCFNFISLLQHVLFQSFWFSCFPTRNSTFQESRCFFKAEKYCFYCRSWCNMKGCFFIGICNVFYVSMKRDMLIVTFFLLVVVSTSTPCCNMLQHVLFQSFHVPWTWR